MIGVYYILLSQRNAFANVIERRLCVCELLVKRLRLSAHLLQSEWATASVTGHPDPGCSHTLCFCTVLSPSLVPSYSYLNIAHHR